MIFINYLANKGVSNSTMVTYLKNLGRLLSWGLERDLHENSLFSKAIAKAKKNFNFFG